MSNIQIQRPRNQNTIPGIWTCELIPVNRRQVTIPFNLFGQCRSNNKNETARRNKTDKYKNCNCTDNRKLFTLQLPLVNTDTSFLFQYLTEFKYDYRMTTFVILNLGFKALKRHSTGSSSDRGSCTSPIPKVATAHDGNAVENGSFLYCIV